MSSFRDDPMKISGCIVFPADAGMSSAVFSCPASGEKYFKVGVVITTIRNNLPTTIGE